MDWKEEKYRVLFAFVLAIVFLVMTYLLSLLFVRASGEDLFTVFIIMTLFTLFAIFDNTSKMYWKARGW